MNDSESLLLELIERALADRTRQKERVKRIAWTLRISVMFLGMIATVLLGWSFGDGTSALRHSRDAALVCTALSTFLAGLAAFWSVDTYWIRLRVMASRLESLVEEIRFESKLKDGLTEEEVRMYFDRYHEVQQQQSAYWEEVLSRVKTAPRATEASSDIRNQ